MLRKRVQSKCIASRSVQSINKETSRTAYRKTSLLFSRSNIEKRNLATNIITMTTYLSYQHAEVNSISNGDLATDTSININNKNNKSSNNNNRIVRSMMAVGVVFLLAIANEALSTSNNDANTTQGMMLRPKRVPLALFSSKNDDDYHNYGTDDQYPYDNATEPDYNGEGKYDWQKCQDSSDPDCWKNEGERVGSYWDNFGQRTGAYWTSFGDAIKNFFTSGSKAEESKPLPPPPPPPTPASAVEEKEVTPVLEDDDDDMISTTVVEEKEATPVLEDDDDDMISATVVEEKETTPALEEDEDDATPATVVEEKETTPALEEDEVDDAVVDTDSTVV